MQNLIYRPPSGTQNPPLFKEEVSRSDGGVLCRKSINPMLFTELPPASLVPLSKEGQFFCTAQRTIYMKENRNQVYYLQPRIACANLSRLICPRTFEQLFKKQLSLFRQRGTSRLRQGVRFPIHLSDKCLACHFCRCLETHNLEDCGSYIGQDTVLYCSVLLICYINTGNRVQ